MLQWAAAGPGRRLTVVIPHNGAEREYAYDRKSPVGRLDKALDAVSAGPWIFVSMKADWKTVFPGTAP
jgi:hypothetical protein